MLRESEGDEGAGGVFGIGGINVRIWRKAPDWV